MDDLAVAIAKYRTAFNAQRCNAKKRGIDFLLTFQEWCNWWGEDIALRGTSPTSLQMQRHADTGPYALWNIRKGVPKQNSATAKHMRAKKKSEQAAHDLQVALDNMMNEPSLEPYDGEWSDDDKELNKLGMRSSKQIFSYRFHG